jgi:hypothetical protein
MSELHLPFKNAHEYVLDLCMANLFSLGIHLNYNSACSTITRRKILGEAFKNPFVISGILSLVAGIALFVAGFTTNDEIMWGVSIALLVIGVACLWIGRSLFTQMFYDVIQFQHNNESYRVLYTVDENEQPRKYHLYDIKMLKSGTWVVAPEDIKKQFAPPKATARHSDAILPQEDETDEHPRYDDGYDNQTPPREVPLGYGGGAGQYDNQALGEQISYGEGEYKSH